MKSWDCFDTLVARRFFDPASIFDEVGKRLNIPDFKKMRIYAEKKSNRTFEGIYHHLPEISPNVEFQVELEHCYGIVENLKKVKDGDLIISDMYLTNDQVAQILKSCGLTANVSITVTYNGKKKGWVWDTVPRPELHTGDNEISDVASPNQHNINSELYTGYKFNEIESFIAEHDFDLACWSRYIRLQCPYDNNTFQRSIWFDQANLNLPVLALATLELPSNKKIAFTYRDSVHWHKIYESITGNIGIRFDASRICYYNPNQYFLNYCESLIKDCLIVDLQGTGDSSNAFFKGNQEVLVIAGPSEPPTKYMVEKIAWAIEYHNINDLGRVIGWDNNGPVRDTPDHDMRAVPIVNEAVKIACESVKWFNIKSNKTLLESLVAKMHKNFTHKSIKYKKN
jgi:predicted HAD superfamily hydrolase